MNRSATTAGCLTIVAAIALGCEEKKAPAPPPPEVQVFTVTPRDVPIYREWVGTIDANVNAEVRARVQGVIQTQDYTEGSVVKEGQLLFTLEPNTLKASQAEATGSYQRAKAAWDQAKIEVDRYTHLVAGGAASQMELDRNIALERAARAQVEAYSGTVQKTKIDLSYAQVLAPIEGIAGIAQVKIGNLVGKAEPTLLTTISNVNPVRVAFPITEPEYLNAADALKNPETMGNGEGYLELILANGKVYAKKGRLVVANREFDPRTGTMTLQALFPNPDLLLRPGQYGRVRAVVRNVKDALAIPQRAVAELQGITQVAVVGPQEKIEIRPVKLGERSGSFWIVTSGLKAGDRVVAEGLQKVKPDMTVVPKPFDTSALKQPDAASDTPELIPGAATPATPVPSGKPSGP